MKRLLLVLGGVWSLPHTAIGLLALITVYWPKAMRWETGALHVVVRWSLIPRGMENFRTGAQTHGFIIFYADEAQAMRSRLICHESWHVYQGMLLGPLYPVLYGLLFLVELARKRDVVRAYEGIWFERWAYAREKGPLPWLLR